MQPQILEVNFNPDCERACKYHPSFFNDIFSTLFLDEPDRLPCHSPSSRRRGPLASASGQIPASVLKSCFCKVPSTPHKPSSQSLPP